MRPFRILFVLGALLTALAALAWVLTAGERGHEASALTQALTGGERERPALDLASLAVTAEPPEAAPEVERAPERASVPVDPLLLRLGGMSSDADGRPRVFLRGTVDGAGLDPTGTELEVGGRWYERRLGDFGRTEVSTRMRAVVGPEWTFEVEVTELFYRGVIENVPDQLVVRADHHASLRVDHRVPILHGTRRPTRSDLADNGVTVFETVVVLEPAGHVTGRIVSLEEPQPGHVQVAAFRLVEGRPEQSVEQKILPPGELFTLRLPVGEDYVLVYLADGCRPKTGRLFALGPGGVDLPLQLLERGASIEGTLRPGLGLRGEGTMVVARRAGPPFNRYSVGTTSSLFWLDGAFEWSSRRALGGEGGRFAFTGLAPIEYRLEVVGVGVPGERLTSVEAATVTAPASGLELGPLVTRVTLEFRRGAAFEPGVAFEVERLPPGKPPNRLGKFSGDEAGRAVLWLPGDSGYRVHFGDPPRARLLDSFADRAEVELFVQM